MKQTIKRQLYSEPLLLSFSTNGINTPTFFAHSRAKHKPDCCPPEATPHETKTLAMPTVHACWNSSYSTLKFFLHYYVIFARRHLEMTGAVCMYTLSNIQRLHVLNTCFRRRKCASEHSKIHWVFYLAQTGTVPCVGYARAFTYVITWRVSCCELLSVIPLW